MDELRIAIIEAGKAMITSELTRGSAGNISARIPGTSKYLITPSGMDYFSLQPEDLVLADFETKEAEGKRRPSIVIHLHGEIYRARADVNGVVHTHSPYASAMAAARRPVPPVLDLLGIVIGGQVEVAEHAAPGTLELAHNAVKALGDRNGVLLANHGAIGVGSDLKAAFKAADMIEQTAMAALFAALMGGAVVLTPEQIKVAKETVPSYYGQR
jgi:L-fuculose-phosphate aldolase